MPSKKVNQKLTTPAPSRMSDRSPQNRLMAFYPLLYVAWADGELTPEESEILRGAIVDSGLDIGAFSNWLDPDNPPDPTEVGGLLAAIRRGASGLVPDLQSSLASLGIAIAKAEGELPTAEECEAIVRVEKAFGLPGFEAAAYVLNPARPIAELPEVRPRFDVEAMTRFLDGDAASAKARFRALLSDGRFEHVYGLTIPQYRKQVLSWCRLLADEGLGALSFPAEYSGNDDQVAFLAAFETLAFFDLSLLVKFGVQFGLFGGSIHQLGSREHHEKYLPDVATMALPGCFAMTETGHGSNVYDIETTATYDPETRDLEIHTPHRRARKDYIGNAANDALMATVFAQLKVGDEEHGVHAILVRIREDEGTSVQGVTIEDCGEKLGLNGVDNGRLTFDHVRVPRENLLDRFAWINDDGAYRSPIANPTKRFFTMLGTLVAGRVAIGSAAVSVGKVALTIAIRYGARRRQFGAIGELERPLLDYPSYQRRLLPALATTYGLNFALHDLQKQYVAQDRDVRQTEADTAGLKAYATWHATETIQECREACGGQGYLAINRFAALKADSDVFTTFEGDNTLLLQLVAKGLLTDFRNEFGDLGTFGVARFIADRAAQAITERNPIISRKRNEGHLRDPEFHYAMFEARASDLVFSLAERVRARIKKGQSPFDALTECQHHALTAARAHVEHCILKAMLAAQADTSTSGVAEWIDRLRCLYALATIERRRAWYLEEGYVDPPKSKAIRSLVTRLCAEIRPQAVPLVDAFEIPEACIRGSVAS